MLPAWNISITNRAIVRTGAITALVFFLATSFRAGWTHSTTDFPNYYTAAVLVRNGARLRNYYDWTWFQKQMNYAGIENQLGGYMPQTPLTMLPMIPVAELKPLTAKRVWLTANLAFLGVTVWLLSRLASFSASQVFLLAFAGYGSLHSNFLLGQYYVFLLFLLVLAFYCLRQQKDYGAGLLCGAAFVLKLYGAPFILYFIVKRNWKFVAGMALATASAIALATMLFGWDELAYFTSQILPRAVQGETLDPYNSGNGTFSTLLRRAFILEPELNAHPLWNMPLMFFFLQPFFTIFLLALPLIYSARNGAQAEDFAWFYIALILASPNTASYTFILLLLPVALLLKGASSIERLALIFCYAAVSWPMCPAWSWLFPKVWLLLALFFIAGGRHLRLIKARHALVALVFAVAFAVPVAWRHLQLYRREPGRRWEQIAVQRGAVYSSNPAVLRSGIVYESIGKVHYVLRWLHDGENKELAFEGEAFHPVAQSPDGPIQFDLVANGKSTSMLFDLFTGKLTRASSPPPRTVLAIMSPDGQWIASIASTAASKQLSLRKASSRRAVLLAGGNCNSFSPAWALDSKSIVFASDCDRGLGLPALYRARLDRVEDLH